MSSCIHCKSNRLRCSLEVAVATRQLVLVVDCSWAVEVCLHLGHSRGDIEADDMVCDA